MSQSDRASLLAACIYEQVKSTEPGHCARVDYFELQDAWEICAGLRNLGSKSDAGRIDGYVLTTGLPEAGDSLSINMDRAVELRNLKLNRLCLFIPADIVDPASSSLANSFAVLDGRSVLKQAITAVRGELNGHARALVSAVENRLTGAARVGEDQLLDFALAARGLQKSDQLDLLGLELWRVNLICDANPEFEKELKQNIKLVGQLVRPKKLLATNRERIASLGVDDITARKLESFFRTRPLINVGPWSQELVKEGWDLSQWKFPEVDAHNLDEISVTPFRDAKGNLKPPVFESEDGRLWVQCQERAKLTVKWSARPAKLNNVHSWRVSLEIVEPELAPDDEKFVDLPIHTVKSEKRAFNIPLTVELDEPMHSAVHARVVAIDHYGNELVDREGNVIAGVSDPMHLTPESSPQISTQQSPKKRAVPNLPFGRLKAATQASEEALTLGVGGCKILNGLVLLEKRVNETQVLTVALPKLLVDLETRSATDLTHLKRYSAEAPELRELTETEVKDVIISSDIAAVAKWVSDERKSFFARLKDACKQNLQRSASGPHEVYKTTSPETLAIALADWTPALHAAALKYGQSYLALLKSARQEENSQQVLSQLLSIETVHVSFNTSSGPEDAVIVLPTHPLRALWYASYAALLLQWEDGVLAAAPKQRPKVVDILAVQSIEPINVPAFVPLPNTRDIYPFFRNLAFFYGVALPASAPDPTRRFHDLEQAFGWVNVSFGDEREAARLGEYLHDYRETHPYADPLTVGLFNPDNGQLFAGAAAGMADRAQDDDGEFTVRFPRINLLAYSLDCAAPEMQGLDDLARIQSEMGSSVAGDFLQPTLAVTTQRLEAKGSLLPDCHVAVLTDLSRPAVLAVPELTETRNRGFALYGLLARFIGELSQDGDAAQWLYRVGAYSEEKSEQHPGGAKLTEMLIDAHRTWLRAVGTLLKDSTTEMPVPAVVVRVDEARRTLLEHIHEKADWVITVDRFIGVELYDSPQPDTLRQAARKYLLDYSPEFLDGLGHRLLLTTAHRQEVEAILRHAIEELGFSNVHESVGQLLHYLKMVSGRLALQALSRATTGTAAVSMGMTIAWLKGQGQLDNAIAVPVDVHRDIFWTTPKGAIDQGDRRCDLALFSFKKNSLDVTFIEVKWRRGPLPQALDALEIEIGAQTHATSQTLQERFFGPQRVDGMLQRARLAEVLRFYCQRAVRYGLIKAAAADAIDGHIKRLEREQPTLKLIHEGIVISLEELGREPIVREELTLRVLTLADFADLQAANVAGAAAALDHEPDPEPPAPDLEDAAAEPSATALPKVQTDSAAVRELTLLLGHGITMDTDVFWQPSTKGSPHLFITGIPGQGKTWTILHLLQQIHAQGVPALVFDFHGQLASDPRYAGSTVQSVLNAGVGLPFSPLELPGDAQTDLGVRSAAFSLAEIIGRVCDLGPMQTDVLYRVVLEAYKEHGFGGAPSQAGAIIPSLEDVRLGIEEAEKKRRTTNLLARCRPILEMGLFAPDDTAQFNLIAAALQGMIIDVHELSSDLMQDAACAFVMQRLYRDMFKWGTSQELRLALVLDEAHRLSKDPTLPKLMKEGRKYGLFVILASQSIADFDQQVLATVGTKVAFRTNNPESRKSGSQFHMRAGQLVKEVIESLQVGQAVVQTPQMQVAMKVRMSEPRNSNE